MFTVPENVHSYSARKGLQLRFTENVPARCQKMHSVRKRFAGKCSQCQKRFTVPENVQSASIRKCSQCQKRFTVPEKVHSARKGSQCLKRFTVPVSENVRSQCQKRFTASEKVHSRKASQQKSFTWPGNVHSAGKCSQAQKMFTVLKTQAQKTFTVLKNVHRLKKRSQ